MLCCTLNEGTPFVDSCPNQEFSAKNDFLVSRLDMRYY